MEIEITRKLFMLRATYINELNLVSHRQFVCLRDEYLRVLESFITETNYEIFSRVQSLSRLFSRSTATTL